MDTTKRALLQSSTSGSYQGVMEKTALCSYSMRNGWPRCRAVSAQGRAHPVMVHDEVIYSRELLLRVLVGIAIVASGYALTAEGWAQNLSLSTNQSMDLAWNLGLSQLVQWSTGPP